jgi:hypothetical protein
MAASRNPYPDTPFRSARQPAPTPGQALDVHQNKTTLIDVDNVALLDDSGRNLVRNGDFSKGMQRWFFSTDSHLAWHTKNLFVHVLFEQGWFGLGAFVVLLAATDLTLLRRAGHDAMSLTLFNFADIIPYRGAGGFAHRRAAARFFVLLATGNRFAQGIWCLRPRVTHRALSDFSHVTNTKKPLARRGL